MKLGPSRHLQEVVPCGYCGLPPLWEVLNWGSEVHYLCSDTTNKCRGRQLAFPDKESWNFYHRNIRELKDVIYGKENNSD